MTDLTFVTRYGDPANSYRLFRERRETFLRLGSVRVDDGFTTFERADGTLHTVTYATLRARSFFDPDEPYRTSMINPGDLGIRPLNFRMGRVSVRYPSTTTVITTSSRTHQFLRGRVRIVEVSLSGSVTKFGVWSEDNQVDPATGSYVETATDVASANVTQHPTRHHAVFVPHPDTRYLGIGARVFDVPNSGTHRRQYFKKWMLEKAPVGTTMPSAKYGKAREVQVFVKPDRINLGTGPLNWTSTRTMTTDSISKVQITTNSINETLDLRLNDISVRAGQQYWLVSDIYTDNAAILLHAEWNGVPVNSDVVQLAPGRWTRVAIRLNAKQNETSRFTWKADIGDAFNTTTGVFTPDATDVGTYQPSGVTEDLADIGTYLVSPTLEDTTDPGTYLPGETVGEEGTVTVLFENVLMEKATGTTPDPYFNGSTSADTVWEKGGVVGRARSYLYKNRQPRYEALKRVLEENVPLGIGIAEPVFATYPVDW